MRILRVIFVLSILFTLPLWAEELPHDYHRLILDNGLAVVAKHVPTSSLVAIELRVLSGLSNEGEYASSGVSHFLEHLLFKGTKNKNSNEIRRAIKAMGGTTNGSTGLDSANYYITVPNEYFEEALELLVDMVYEPVFTDEEMEKERAVIMNEINLEEDEPLAKLTRLIFSKAYREHVYKNPVIGYKESLQKLTRKDILDYYARVYTPERMVLGIVGGVEPKVMLEAAEKKMSKYSRGSWHGASISHEPKQISETSFTVHDDVILGYMSIAFHTTSLYSSDLYSGDVLSILLGEGNSSHLYKRLVKEKELLYTISSVNYTPRYPGLFIITGVGEPAKLNEAREEIFRVIEELASYEIKDEELERARNLVGSNYLHSHEGITSIASSITDSQLFTSNPAFFEKYVDEVKKVGKDDLKEALLKYLTRDNSTTVFLLPKGYGLDTSKPAEVSLLAEKEELIKLANGLKVILKRKAALPLVSVTYATMGGLRVENSETNGIANLVSSLLVKGTKNRIESEILPRIEEMGGSLGAFSGMNSMGLTLDLQSQDLNRGLEIFLDVLINPIFPEEEILKIKKKIIASIREQENDIFENGMIVLRKLLFNTHPYGMRILGQIETIENIKREDLVSFHKEYFVPGSAVLSIVGDIDIGKIKEIVMSKFAGWEGKSAYIDEKIVEPIDKPIEKVLTMEKQEALVLLGFQGVKVNERERYALDIVSSILSGSDGLLFYTAREKLGLAYAQGAINAPSVEKGYFLIYIATIEQNIPKAKKVILDTLEKIRNGNITNEEIESSKNWLISEHAHSLEINSSMSMMMALDELYGLGFQDYKRYKALVSVMSKDDVVECAKRVLDPTKAAAITIHSQKIMR